MLSADCYSGKAEWITKFDQKRGKHALRDLMICNSKDKHLIAGPTRILIDDREANVKDWQTAGGLAVLHKGDFKETLRAVRAITQALRQSRKFGPGLNPPKP